MDGGREAQQGLKVPAGRSLKMKNASVDPDVVNSSSTAVRPDCKVPADSAVNSPAGATLHRRRCQPAALQVSWTDAEQQARALIYVRSRFSVL